MKNFLILTSMLVFLMSTNAQPEDCEIPGKTIPWIADYCMYQAETDDFLDEKVQACFKKIEGTKLKTPVKTKKNQTVTLNPFHKALTVTYSIPKDLGTFSTLNIIEASMGH